EQLVGGDRRKHWCRDACACRCTIPGGRDVDRDRRPRGDWLQPAVNNLAVTVYGPPPRAIRISSGEVHGAASDSDCETFDSTASSSGVMRSNCFARIMKFQSGSNFFQPEA